MTYTVVVIYFLIAHVMSAILPPVDYTQVSRETSPVLHEQK